MSAYANSRIVRARKPYECERCKQRIEAGQDYLRYALGLKWSVHVCLHCASTSGRYRCRATEEAFG